MTARIAVVSFFALSFGLPWLITFQTPVAWAGRDLQGPAPTEEPTKPPYIFPTPIFIPTYGSAGPAASTPVSTRVAAQPSGERTYTVEAGDNPWTIAQKLYGNGAKYQVIMTANGLTDSTKLKVGMVLKIPATDAAGQPLPTAAPTLLAPALAAPSLPAPTLQPTPAGATATPTRAPAANGLLPASIADAAVLALNVITTLFIIGAILAGIFAVLVYRRSRRLKEMTVFVRRLRIR